MDAAARQLEALKIARAQRKPICQTCCKSFPTSWLLLAHMKHSLVHQVCCPYLLSCCNAWVLLPARAPAAGTTTQTS